MQQALIRLTLKLTTSTCHDAENLDYYQTHQRQYAEYKKGLERQGKSIVEFLDKEFPEELPFHEDKRLPISEVKIKVLETSKENNKTFRFELWVTTEQSILIEQENYKSSHKLARLSILIEIWRFQPINLFIQNNKYGCRLNQTYKTIDYYR